MDTNNPVIRLCIAGTRAEFDGRMDVACRLYRQAWGTSASDYEACIAAHYLARCQDSPEETFHWNRVASERALAANDESVKEFFPSLYLNMGRSYELLGNQAQAKKFFDRAAELGVTHQME